MKPTFVCIEHNCFGEQLFKYIVSNNLIVIANDEGDWQPETLDVINQNGLVAVDVYKTTAKL